jgi:GT2 family glycosyltransferase
MKLLERLLAQLRRVWERDGKLAFARRLLGPLLVVSYRTWTAKSDPTGAHLAQQRVDAQALPYRPLLTVVVFAGDAPPALVDASIRCVVNQSYDRWELRLTGDPLQNRETKRLAGTWAERDARICFDDAGAQAPPILSTSQGEFIVPLSAGDALAPHALFEVVRLLNDHRGAEIVYFDEDTLSADARTRSSPFFKPGWSPEMLLSANYLAHAIIKRTLLERIDPLAGARDQSWNLALRSSERAREIRHVAKVLYHVREGVPSAPPRAEDLAALEAHCRRIGIADPRAAVVPPGVVRLTWPTAEHKISIIIPNKDRVALLRRCLASLLARTDYPHFEILLIDTGSTDIATHQYYASLAPEPRIRIVEHPGPFNYSAVNNAGVRAATGDLLLFLNNDTEALNRDWLEEMVRWAERREIGAVGAKLLYPDNTIQHAGIVIGLRGLAHHIYRHTPETHVDLFGSVDWYRNYLAVTGACLMMRREVFDRVGGFDETYHMAFGDIELCLRIHEHGYRIMYTPFAKLRHDEGATRGSYSPPSDTRRALERIRDLVASGDPFFHPSLSHESLVPMLPRRGDRIREVLLKRRLARTPTA